MKTQSVPVWKSFDFDKVDYGSSAERLAALRKKPFGITVEAERVVASVHIVSCHSGGTVNFGRVSCHDLGCEKASYPEFIEFVVKNGIHLCTFAHVLLLRRLLDQEPGTFVSVAMEAVTSSLGKPSFFILTCRKEEGGIQFILDASGAYPFGTWYPHAKFVVVLPPTFQ